MKKMFVLFALCAMASSLMAASKGLPFTEDNYKSGKLNVPIVYTGMLKINGWGDEGLCYNWQQTRTSFPLFLGLCQPCLDCVPCDIDMRHLKPQAQYGNYQTQIIGGKGLKNAVTNADPSAAVADTVDPTEAFFSRARLYIVTDIDTKDKDADIVVVDLIDAYWGKDNKSMVPVMFQFFNTVDSDGSSTVKGRTGAFYQFPIYSREIDEEELAHKGKTVYGMNNVLINIFDTDDTTNNHDIPNHKHVDRDQQTGEPRELPCGALKVRGEDGIGLAAVIGTKDSKSFFKVKNENGKMVSMPIVSIKSFTGDFFAWQYNYTDRTAEDEDKPQYVCRKGEEYVVYAGSNVDADGHNDPAKDGRGAWYATGSITLRRNDSVTKKMMEQLNKDSDKINCIPCNKTKSVPICRNYLDEGIVEYLIQKQYKNWKIDYLVDLDNDGIYGEPVDNCDNSVTEVYKPTFRQERGKDVMDKDASELYLKALVNVDETNDATQELYNLPAASADLNGAIKASAGRYLEDGYYHQPSTMQAPTK